MEVIDNVQHLYQELHAIREDLDEIKEVVRSRAAIRTENPYIVRIEGVRGGEPIIIGTGISVRTIVERTRLGETPGQIVASYPVLTLAKVYAALAYYHDHQPEINAYIAENEAALWKRSRPSP